MKCMAMYAYVAGTTNNDINDEGSIACQINFLKQTNVDYDAYFIDTFSGLCQARFQLQKLLMIVKPGDMIDVMDVSNLTSNTRELCCLLNEIEDLQITIFSDELEMGMSNSREPYYVAKMLCRADMVTMMQQALNCKKMCHLTHQINVRKNKGNKQITQKDYEVYKMLMNSDYKTTQQATGLSRSTLYRLKKRIQQQ
ncbi:resolvase [Lactobacillus reuteri]|uniref:recombinase family protein n=3 Tax=Limosilactobacillus reuteri TaxID=1598 RepID=UPI00128CD7D9|nr:recombinase family protein [Limosilactobacillus reuteri]MQB73683.1 resolvase [Limosilactobacillus reuteri]